MGVFWIGCPDSSTGRLCHFVLNAGQVKCLATKAKPGSASPFLLPAFLLCSQCHGASGSTALCCALSWKKGPWTQLSKLIMIRNVHLFLKKQQKVANVECIVSFCLQLSRNTIETSTVPATCLLYHLHPPGASGGRQPHEISLPNRFFLFCFKGNKENKCIIIYGRTCALPIRTGALQMGQAIHVWILRKSKWLM